LGVCEQLEEMNRARPKDKDHLQVTIKTRFFLIFQQIGVFFLHSKIFLGYLNILGNVLILSNAKLAFLTPFVTQNPTIAF
jgi:hypothetical protein